MCAAPSRTISPARSRNGPPSPAAPRKQKEGPGISKAERMAQSAACRKETGNVAAVVQAMQPKGYYLAQGDQRDYVVIDVHGEIHSLSRQLKGTAKTREMRDRLSAHPPDRQPDIETTRALIRQKRREAVRAAV